MNAAKKNPKDKKISKGNAKKDKAAKIADLLQLVEQKTKLVKQLNVRLEKEDAELVELEQQLEALEDEKS